MNRSLALDGEDSDDDVAGPEHGGSEAAADVEQRHAEVPAGWHGERLDKVLVRIAPEFSRSHLQHLIDGGHVTLDGQPARTASRRLKVGQQVTVQLVPTAESRAFRPEAIALDIVFEDEHLMVVNKPAGMVVHPAAGNWSGTLLNALLAHHAAAATLPRAGIVHRLDKDTSGLMVVGKTLPAVTTLVREIAARTVSRQYLALAHGAPREPRFTVDAPIGRDPSARVRMAVVPSGKPARTDVELLASARLDGEAAAVASTVSALRCTLHTGRTHQIRVHLASRGHPLVADVLYGGKPLLGLARQALHAAHLAFEHPLTRAALRFDAPLPPDLAAAWARVEEGAR
jgi:23S rRNA pseudouridine1911/1915/1917 synthase